MFTRNMTITFCIFLCERFMLFSIFYIGLKYSYWSKILGSFLKRYLLKRRQLYFASFICEISTKHIMKNTLICINPILLLLYFKGTQVVSLFLQNTFTDYKTLAQLKLDAFLLHNIFSVKVWYIPTQIIINALNV